MKEVVLAGAAGGFVYWCLAMIRGGLPGGELAPFPVEQWRWISLVFAGILGAAAAFVAVYWLANTDVTKRNQCLGFALVCGVMWEPVLTGAGERLTNEFDDSKAEKAVQEAKEVNRTVDSGVAPPPQRTAEVAAMLAQSVPNIQNPVLKVEASESAEQLLATLAKQAAAAEPEATRGLEKVGVAAAESNSTKLIAKTIQHLDGIATSGAPQAGDAKAAILRIRGIAASQEKK